MSLLQELLPFVLLGALGSMHCVGMCGGFALSAVRGCAGSCRGANSLPAIALFGLGKALTYGVLGVALAQVLGLGAAAGSELFDASAGGTTRASGWHLVAPALVVLAGLFLVASGLHQLGLWSWPARWSVLRRPIAALQRMLAPLRSAGGRGDAYTGAFATGVLTGLLPCGLSWSAFVLAATRPTMEAGLGLFAFGFSTVPALAAFALGWQFFSVRVRSHGMRLSGVLLIAFGLLTLSRANSFASADDPAACHDSSAVLD